jgi:hypothetical protein
MQVFWQCCGSESIFADPDPNPTSIFDADPDPDRDSNPERHQNDTNPHAEPTRGLTHVVKSGFFYYSTDKAVLRSILVYYILLVNVIVS